MPIGAGSSMVRLLAPSCPRYFAVVPQEFAGGSWIHRGVPAVVFRRCGLLAAVGLAGGVLPVGARGRSEAAGVAAGSVRVAEYSGGVAAVGYARALAVSRAG